MGRVCELMVFRLGWPCGSPFTLLESCKMWLSVELFLRSGSFPANNSPTSYCGLQNGVSPAASKQAMDVQGVILQNANFYLLPVFNAVSPSRSSLPVLWAQGTSYLCLSREKSSCVLSLLYLAYLAPEPHQILHWESIDLLLDFSSSSSWTFCLLLSAKSVSQHPWLCCQFSLAIVSFIVFVLTDLYL